MKRIIAALTVGMLVSALQTATAQGVLVNSWENSVEGWGTLEANWTSGGFSTTTGVTDGTYSWMLTAAAGPDYGAAIGGTASTTLTSQLANAASVSLDVYATAEFGGYLQFDLTLNQQGGLGYASVDSYSYSQAAVLGSESTLTFAIPSAMRTTLAANPTLATSLNYQIGGGGGGTIYLDNLRINEVPEPGTFALLALGAAGFLTIRRRKA